MLNKIFFNCIIILIFCFNPVLNASNETLLSSLNDSFLEQNYEDETNPFEFLMLQQYYLLGWTTLIVIIVGISGNIFTIIVLKHPTMKSPINIHFTGLAISDLICLILIFLSIPLRYILGNSRKIFKLFFFFVIFFYFSSQTSTTLVS